MEASVGRGPAGAAGGGASRGVAGVLRAALSPPVLQMVARVYVPVLFPLTFLLALGSVRADAALGWGPLRPAPWHLVAAGVSFAAGAALWMWVYADLVRQGRGSPAPVAGRTVRLATRGWYGVCRNPSLYGKTLGFLAVGLALDSPFFCLVLTPVLLAGSLVEKVVRQEPQLVEVFGDDYLRYRREVPLILPRWRGLRALLRRRVPGGP